MSRPLRFSIVLAISVGLHLALMAVELRQGGPSKGGDSYVIRLVSRSLHALSPEIDKPDQHLEQPANITQKMVRHPQKTQVEEKKAPPGQKPATPTLAPVRLISPHPQRVVESSESEIDAQVEPLREAIEAEPQTLPTESVETPSATESEGAARLASVVPAPSAGERTSRLSSGVLTRQAIPRYVENPPPEYPEVARRNGWEGEVQLQVAVDRRGEVASLSVRRSSGYILLDRAAQKAVKLWRFIPARNEIGNVASEVVVPINFRLPEAREGKTRL